MFEEKMKLQADKVGRLMARLNWTPNKFADAINVEIEEAYKLLSGKPVNYYTAQAFIEYFKAPFAGALIDFAGMGIEPPKFLKLQAVSDDALFGSIAMNIRDLEKEVLPHGSKRN